MSDGKELLLTRLDRTVTFVNELELLRTVLPKPA